MRAGSTSIYWAVNFKGSTWLYKPVGGAGASFCTILNMLHITFFKIKKYLQII